MGCRWGHGRRVRRVRRGRSVARPRIRTRRHREPPDHRAPDGSRNHGASPGVVEVDRPGTSRHTVLPRRHRAGHVHIPRTHGCPRLVRRAAWCPRPPHRAARRRPGGGMGAADHNAHAHLPGRAHRARRDRARCAEAGGGHDGLRRAGPPVRAADHPAAARLALHRAAAAVGGPAAGDRGQPAFHPMDARHLPGAGFRLAGSDPRTEERPRPHADGRSCLDDAPGDHNEDDHRRVRAALAWLQDAQRR